MHLPACLAATILTFVPVFLQQRTWRHAELLLIGAILAPAKRTVTSILRIAGRSRERRLTNYHRVRGRRHKKLTDWARQMTLQARRWLPRREIVLLGDSSFAALDLLAALVRQGLVCITRLRLDAALHEPAPPRRPGTVGRPRTKGAARLPTLAAVLAAGDTRWVPLTVPGW
jgi:hypothetical protein